MERQFSWSGQISLGTFKAGFQPAFGKYIGSKRDLGNELARHKGETGSELHEIGNEKTGREPLKKPDLKAAVNELRSKWRN